MTDQNLPEKDNLNQGTQEGTRVQEGDAVQEEASSFSEATTLPIDTTSQEGGVYSPQAVPETPPPPPTIVVPAGGNGVPKWFYFIFGITLIVFFVVTGLLVNSLLQKSTPSLEKVALSPTKTSVSPSSLPSTTPTPLVETTPSLVSPPPEATDQAVLELKEYSISDEVSQIQTDIEKTDLSSIREGLEVLDREMGVTFEARSQ